MSGVAVADLFAGAGGLGLGVIAAGADLRVSVDLDPASCETLRLNARKQSGDVVEADVAQLSGAALRRLARVAKREPFVVVGGAPCQPFSKAAYWIESGQDARYRRARARGESAARPTPLSRPRLDKRRTLTDDFFRLVLASKADGFVFENVPSILHPRNKKAFLGLLAEVESRGYITTIERANAVAFGVPQKRERIFVLGMRRRTVEPPSATHSTTPDDDRGLLPMPTAGPALAPFATPRFHEPEEVIRGRWAAHLSEVPPGWNYKWHTAWAGHRTPTFVTETRYWHFLLKLHPDLPSWTVPAGPGPWTGPFHWDSRRLRTPEYAALQGFPREYTFSGSRRARIRQIGNAVPPQVGQAMIRSVLDAVEGLSSQHRRRAS